LQLVYALLAQRLNMKYSSKIGGAIAREAIYASVVFEIALLLSKGQQRTPCVVPEHNAIIPAAGTTPALGEAGK